MGDARARLRADQPCEFRVSSRVKSLISGISARTFIRLSVILSNGCRQNSFQTDNVGASPP